MSDWQQTLIDERGGADGQTYDRLLADCRAVHMYTNPEYRVYNTYRTARAIILGAAIFESFCQDAFMSQLPATLPKSHSEPKVDYLNHASYRIPESFVPLIEEYHGAYRMRASQDGSRPSITSQSFGFYACAEAKILDPYAAARIEAEDFGDADLETMKSELNRSRDMEYTMYWGITDNVGVTVDALVAMGAGLCIYRQRACTASELGEFILDNINVVTTPATATRKQRRGPDAALPYGYGKKILDGDAAMMRRQCVHVVNQDGRHVAQWVHRALRYGNRKRPGHCPASDNNPLHPRDGDLPAVQKTLENAGLGHLLIENKVTSSRLALSRALPLAIDTIFADKTWQERLLKANQ